MGLRSFSGVIALSGCACVLVTSCAKTRHTGVSASPAIIETPAPPPAEAVEGDSEEREDEAREAAEFYLLKRAPDGQNLPVERYLKAKESTARVRVYSTAGRRFLAPGTAVRKTAADAAAGDAAATGGWTPLGPGNIGGRTRVLLIHPNDAKTMYTATTGGGVWKTTDGGEHWAPMSDLLPSIGIGSLAIDPKSPDTLYAGTGDPLGSVAIRGAGIFKTTDGGATWSQLPGTANPNFYYVNKLAVSPVDSNRVYAATETGVWFSPDGGASWTRALDRSSPDSGCQDLAVRTDQGSDYIFAACGRNNTPSSAIFRNVDAAGGGKWEQVLSATGQGRTALALAPSNQGIIYAVMNSVDPKNPDFLNGLLAVYRSTSNGDSGSWEARVTNADSQRANQSILSYPNDSFADICSTGKPEFKGQGWLDLTIAVDPTNPDSVWVGGIDIFRSDDGGANWGIAMFWEVNGPQRAHADNHSLVFHPAYNGADNQILYNTSDGGVFVTQNARADVATGDRAGCPPYASKVVWKALNNGYAATQFHFGAPYPAGALYWGGTQDNGTIRGSDMAGQNSWTAVAGGDGGFVAVNPSDPNVIYHEFTNLSLAKSVNGGQSFAASTRGITDSSGNFLFIPPFTLDPSSPDRVYLGGKTLWRSADAASNWSAASPPLASSAGLISFVAISASDPNRVMFGTSTGYIYRSTAALSTDKNTVWDSNRPRAGYAAQIAFDPGNADIAYAVYATFKGGSDSYVYKTVDGGNTWTGIDGGGDTGLPDAPASSIVVDPLNSSTIYVGTDLGVFVSLDAGATWSREDAPYVNVPVENLAIDRNSGVSYLFAFTRGRGAWRIALPGSGSPCQYSVSTDKVTFPAFGGTQQVNVNAGDGCMWVAVGNGFNVNSPATGTGNSRVAISAQPNTSQTARAGTVLVQNKPIAITQSAALAAQRNDDSATPQVIASLPYVGIEDTRRLTSSASDPAQSCGNGLGFKTAWWKVVPDSPGTLALSVQGERYDVFGNSGVVMTVYDTQATSDHELGCIARARDTRAWEFVPLSVTVEKGKTYLIEISATGDGANDGGYTILTAALQ